MSNQNSYTQQKQGIVTKKILECLYYQRVVERTKFLTGPNTPIILQDLREAKMYNSSMTRWDSYNHDAAKEDSNYLKYLMLVNHHTLSRKE